MGPKKSWEVLKWTSSGLLNGFSSNTSRPKPLSIAIVRRSVQLQTKAGPISGHCIKRNVIIQRAASYQPFDGNIDKCQYENKLIRDEMTPNVTLTLLT